MADFDPEQDQEVKVEVDMDFSVATLADMVRDRLLIDARGVGDLFGPKAAQRKRPLAAKAQVPGNQRVF
jgi:hypothetical protein